MSAALTTGDEDVPPDLEAAATRPGWRIVLAGKMVHPIDTRPGLLARLATAALDRLPAREVGPDNGAPTPHMTELPGLWALRTCPPPGPVPGPLIVRHRTWRQYGKAYDVEVHFGINAAEALSPPPWAAPLLADQPFARLIRAEGSNDDVMPVVLALAIGQAARLVR